MYDVNDENLYVKVLISIDFTALKHFIMFSSEIDLDLTGLGKEWIRIRLGLRRRFFAVC